MEGICLSVAEAARSIRCRAVRLSPQLLILSMTDNGIPMYMFLL